MCFQEARKELAFFVVCAYSQKQCYNNVTDPAMLDLPMAFMQACRRAGLQKSRLWQERLHARFSQGILKIDHPLDFDEKSQCTLCHGPCGCVPSAAFCLCFYSHSTVAIVH